MIYEKRPRDTAKAADFLRQALATNPRFHIVYSQVAAETLARLEQKGTLSSSTEVAGAR